MRASASRKVAPGMCHPLLKHLEAGRRLVLSLINLQPSVQKLGKMRGLGRLARVVCLWVFSNVAIAAAEDQQREFDYFALVRYDILVAGCLPLRTNAANQHSGAWCHHLSGGACVGSGIPATAHSINAGIATTPKGAAAAPGRSALPALQLMGICCHVSICCACLAVLHWPTVYKFVTVGYIVSSPLPAGAPHAC
jgi:hypothetical protein